PSLLNVAECQNAKFSLSCTRSVTFGSAGSERSNSTPSPMQAPAMMFFSGNAVRSWQPVVSERSVPSGFSPPGLPPSGNTTGVAMTFASSGESTGTSTIEILSCGGWQCGRSGAGPYDETYTFTESPSGSIVWVCDPQSVRTAATYSGAVTSLMSKTWMPSHAFGSEPSAGSLVHESFVRG